MRYLSDEWITAADAALRDASGTAPESRVVVDQHVDNTMSYRVTIGGGTASMVRLVDAATTLVEPDASFHQSAKTARAVATGTTDAHQAFLLGQIRFHGNIDVLIEQRDTFGWLQATLAPVMALTTFD